MAAPTRPDTSAAPPNTVAPPAPASGRGTWIDDWRPEDPQFWESTGKTVARRNLFFSIFSEHIGFSIWSLWSVLVLFLPEPVFGIDPAGKFLLTTLPTALGAFVRLPYTFAVAKFGGRNWTIVSAALLLIPTIATAIVLKPGVSFTTLLVVSCLAGVGGGNFASSMANINAFYPDRLKGWALGLNAGGGNLGVPVVQLVGLLILATAGVTHPRLILAIYIPLIVRRRRRRRPGHGQPDDGAQPAAGHAGGHPRPAHLDHVVPLHRHASARSSASGSPSARCCRTSSPSPSPPRWPPRR